MFNYFCRSLVIYMGQVTFHFVWDTAILVATSDPSCSPTVDSSVIYKGDWFTN
ncbi:hypothetical protein TWF730_011362 [Orbilia blumenaviensis]|uniref:Uncharacterized protein n=1 Tax=Orbilia blumenaviensis TaxID=1796055 RepID=A0AAV9UL34_9PEZI